MRSYLTLALKVLARRKFFTFISLFGISLTLVVLMVVTAILDNAFAPMKPESRFDRVLALYSFGLYGEEFAMSGGVGYRVLDRYLRGLEGAEEISIFTEPNRTVMYHEGSRIEARVKRADAAYWRILDFDFVEGAPFSEADDRDARRVAVINTDLRQRLFGGARAVGRTLDLDGEQYAIVGVVKTAPIVRYAAFGDVYAPLQTLKGSQWREQNLGEFGGLVLARSSSDFNALRAKFDGRLRAFQFDDQRFNRVVAGLDTPFEAFARSLLGNDYEGNRTAVLRAFMLIAACLFALLPALNLISINLSRILERMPEIGIRKAFGAPTRTLIAQFVFENVVLTLLGGLVGFLLALLALEGLARAELIPYARIAMNVRVFLYGLGIAALFGALSGLYPAWRMARLHPVEALRGGAE